MNYVIIAALLPAFLLGWYIYKKDSIQPEPVSQLLRALLYGVMACPLSMCISGPLGALGLYTDEPVGIFEAMSVSFLGAAIPEELAKLFMLWLLLRRNRYFDERMDGIVYAVFVSLGFAGLENVMYLFGNYDEWMAVGISRALFAVPGHFGFGILMGYYYSLVAFSPDEAVRSRSRVRLFVAPIVAHGIYDTLCFAMSAEPGLSGFLAVVFIIFCHRLWKAGKARVEEHLDRDRND